MLEIAKIKELVVKPAHSEELRAGVQHSRRLQLHSDSSIGELPRDSYMADFLKWVGGTEQTNGILPADKFETFKSLITYPLPTTELMESIYKNLARVFEGKNASERYIFQDKALAQQFSEFFDGAKFKDEAFDAMKTGIDTLVVIDLPASQEGSKPEPYYYFIDIADIIDLQIRRDGAVDYAIFYDGAGNTVCVDDTYWRVFSGKKDDLKLVTEAKHELGKAPARMLWTDRMASKNYINRRGPVTSSLGELDWVLFHRISKRHLDLYASYPIIIAYKAEEKKKGEPGEDGKLAKKSAGKQLMGAGSLVRVPAPQVKDDPDLMANPMIVIPAERQSLDYNVEEEKRLADKIFKACVGFDGEPKNEQAKNIKQVQSAFESRKDILIGLKKNFEEIHRWTAETMATLRYRDKFECAEIDYGSEFYLSNENDILDDINNAKLSQAPEAVISDLTAAYFDTKYRVDSETSERVQIMNDLDPFPTKSVTDTLALFTAGLVDREAMLIKINLDAYIRRFERENLPVTEFGEGMEYYKKIDTINQQIHNYAKEQSEKGNPGKQGQEAPNPAGGGAPRTPESNGAGSN